MFSFLVNYFLFHPVKAADFWQPPPPGLAACDLTLTTATDTSIHAWWAQMPEWTPERGVLLYCHGNAGNLSMRGEIVKRWQESLRMAALIFDYPGYGRSGGKPTEAGCYAAADACYDWLTDTVGLGGEKIVLYGGSLGGSVALDLALRRPHRAVVLASAFTSLGDMARRQFPWLPSRILVGGAFDNLAKIGRTGRPIFIAHGTADQLVPFSQGERLFAAAAEPKRFFPMPGQDHHDPVSPECRAAAQEFLATYAP